MRVEYEEVEYKNYSDLADLFSAGNLFRDKRDKFEKVDDWDLLIDLVDDGFRAYKRIDNTIKVTFEKLTYDFWDMSELKEHYENGNLYYKSRDRYYRFEDRAGLSMSAIGGDGIYKRVETPITLEDDLLEIAQADHGRNLEFIYDDGKLNIYDDIFYRAGLEPEIIHALSEVLKRHGK